MMYDTRRTCPVCECRFDEEGQMRAHLLTRHRKSELADAIGAAISEPKSPEPVQPRAE
jgi:hypothetical protein